LHGAAGYISQSNKQEGQITYLSHSNSKLVELQKLLLGETGNADFSWEAWCSKIKSGHRSLIELSTATDAWEKPERESEIYKACSLQIAILSVSVIKWYVPNLCVEKFWIVFCFILFGSFINFISNWWWIIRREVNNHGKWSRFP